MILLLEHTNLFRYQDHMWLAHCISADFKLGKGIARDFNQRFNMRSQLVSHYPIHKWTGKGYCLCFPQNKVCNLITKQYYYNKPTYQALKESLIDFRDYLQSECITEIAIPKIGCGLDMLDWMIVEQIIRNVFYGTAITIHVCYIK